MEFNIKTLTILALVCVALLPLTSSQTVHEFNVRMYTDGGYNALKRLLNKVAKVEGISSFQVNYEKQRVIVETDLSSDYIADIIRKTGRQVWYIKSWDSIELWKSD